MESMRRVTNKVRRAKNHPKDNEVERRAREWEWTERDFGRSGTGFGRTNSTSRDHHTFEKITSSGWSGEKVEPGDQSSVISSGVVINRHYRRQWFPSVAGPRAS